MQTDFIKFVWVYWRPDNIPVMRKMKIGVNEGEMKSLFSPYHAELQACTMKELGEQPLADVLDSVTMRYDQAFGGSVTLALLRRFSRFISNRKNPKTMRSKAAVTTAAAAAKRRDITRFRHA